MPKKISNWEELVEQHNQSGKSIPVFCSEIGIHPNTFYKHRKRIGRCESSEGSTVVEIKHVPSAPPATIVLKTDRFMISLSEGFDESHLRSVLKVIGEIE